MSSFKSQLNQLTEAASSLTTKLWKQDDNNANEELTAFNSQIVSILPLAERYERLFRTTEFNDISDLVQGLENTAIELWNAASLAMKIANGGFKKAICSVKFFASLLCSIADSIDPTLKGKFRLLSCLYKVLTCALDENDTKLSTKAQEHIDRLFKNVESMKSTFDDSAFQTFNRSKVQIFIAKMQLSIRENDVQMAKFYEERADIASFVTTGDTEVILESLRVLYNSSLSLYNQKRNTEVIYFLIKAINYMSTIGNIEIQEFQKIRTSTYSLLVRTCLDDKSAENIKLAEETLFKMEELSNNSLDYFKMMIKLANTRNAESIEVENLIMRMLIALSNSSELKEALAIVNEFSVKDPQGALRCFEYVFVNRGSQGLDHAVIEMILVAIINIYIKDDSDFTQHRQNNLQNFFDAAQKKLCKPLSRKCTSSAITLLWNIGKSCAKNNNFEDSLGWFNLSLHGILEINEKDKPKIQRAIQNCYINLDQFDEAIKIFHLMDDHEKGTLITQYNMFKVYTHKDDEGNLMSCLKQMASSKEANLVPLLALCAMNSTSNTRVAIESMMVLFREIETGVNQKVSIPKSLRYVIELIIKQDNESYCESLLTIFKEAFKFANDSKNIKDYKFSVDELEWLSSQSFNIARNCLVKEDTTYGNLFAEISLQFNSLIPETISSKKQFSLKLWKFRTNLIGLMCTAKDKNLDEDVKWKEIRSRSLNLRLSIDELTIVGEKQADYDEEYKKGLNECLVTCMIFQFESELKLEHWSASESIVKESKKSLTVEFDSTVINILTQEKNTPERVKSNILTLILERSLGEPAIASVKISRWIRLLLKYNDSNIESESNCLKIIHQIYLRISTQQEDNQFPAHEIEWISTTCWNNGISRLFSGEKIQGRLWCNRAMKLSNFVNERFENGLNKLWKEIQHLAD